MDVSLTELGEVEVEKGGGDIPPTPRKMTRLA